MKRNTSRIFAGLLAAVSLFMVITPCYAISDKYTSTGTFWQAVADKFIFNGTIVPTIIGSVCDEVCSESPDKKHHGSLKTYEQNSNKSFTAVCDFCSAEFQVYDADLDAAYKDFVTALPAPGYDSAGRMIWYPTGSDVGTFNIATSSTAYLNIINTEYTKGSNSVIYSKSSMVCTELYLGFLVMLHVPVSGKYRVLAGPAFSYSVASNRGSFSGSKEYGTGSFSRCSTTLTLEVKTPRFLLIGNNSTTVSVSSYHVEVFLPALEVVPDTVSGSGAVGEIYNISTRPSSITGGNYGIVGDNGQITKVENNSSIVNETNNTYYNPATGQTEKITGWSYDYSDRSYKVTLESGDTVSVTYGDENITIQEGDTVYNVYYLVDGNGGTQVDPPAVCEHTWADTSTVAATCTRPGSKLSTCSKCQQTKTETLPALGHDWRVKQTVTTQYDETGQLVRQGYTIFECSRCHEQYKSSDGAIPPGGGSGTDPGEEDGTTIGGLIEKLLNGLGSFAGGIIKGLLSLLTKAVEALGGLAELFTAFVGSLADLWGGYTSFLSAVFPFLPEEFVIIIELGLILVVAAAVFRKFLS